MTLAVTQAHLFLHHFSPHSIPLVLDLHEELPTLSLQVLKVVADHTIIRSHLVLELQHQAQLTLL
jgi:hypothetical protein